MGQRNSDFGPAGAQFKNAFQLGDDLPFRSPMLNQMQRYWRGKAAGRACPDFTDFAAAEVPFFLPFVHLYDIVDPGRAFYARFLGTRISAFNGVDLTGEMITVSSRSRIRCCFAECLDRVASSAQPVRIVTTFGIAGEPPLTRTENFGALLTAGGDDPAIVIIASELRGDAVG